MYRLALLRPKSVRCDFAVSDRDRCAMIEEAHRAGEDFTCELSSRGCAARRACSTANIPELLCTLEEVCDERYYLGDRG